jgi:hypothetical protein
MVVQANLKDETLERIEKISGKHITKGLDRLINECIDKLEQKTHACKDSTEDEDAK